MLFPRSGLEEGKNMSFSPLPHTLPATYTFFNWIRNQWCNQNTNSNQQFNQHDEISKKIKKECVRCFREVASKRGKNMWFSPLPHTLPNNIHTWNWIRNQRYNHKLIQISKFNKLNTYITQLRIPPCINWNKHTRLDYLFTYSSPHTRIHRYAQHVRVANERNNI